MPFAISHIWQEDEGFQKNKILNKAILSSKSDYIILTEGELYSQRGFCAGSLHE